MRYCCRKKSPKMNIKILTLTALMVRYILITKGEEPVMNCVNGTCTSDCMDGKFGSGCRYNCSKGCVNQRCNDAEGRGVCTDGCNPGHWGETCNSPCLTSCRTCIRETGNACTSCPDFRKGKSCEESCKASCPGTGCHINGSCKQITSACPLGKFGKDCHLGCSPNCLYDACNRTSGICHHGCKQGYFGDTCGSVCNSNCKGQLCDVNGECTEGCGRGYYGDSCIFQCNKNCRLFLCYRDTGDCLNGCNNGFYGPRCNTTCSSGCSVCHPETGECIIQSTTVTYGDAGPSTTPRLNHTNLTGYYVLGSLVIILLCGIMILVIVKRRNTNSPVSAEEIDSRRLPDPPVELHSYEYNELTEEEMNLSSLSADTCTPLKPHIETPTTSNSEMLSNVSQPGEKSSHIRPDCLDQMETERNQTPPFIHPENEVVLDNFLYNKERDKTCVETVRDYTKSKYLSPVRGQRVTHSI